MKLKRILSLGLAAAMVFSTLMLTGCGGGGASSDTSYTMWIYSGADASYYADYAENPVIQYLEEQTWGEEEKKIDLEFWVPAAGTAADSFSTMMGSGSYPDILDCSISDGLPIMYQDGIILDLTEYVKEYMPNYQKYLEEHPEVKDYVVNDVDGEEKYLAIASMNEDYPYTYCGFIYRRDWIVKYGTNPQTGAKFTGGYTDESDPDSWEDDVVFPSGGSDPVYISDWEWMFEIFEKAYADLGIDDTYCISINYAGFDWPGDLCSCFGGGNMNFYKDKDGKVQFGSSSDHARAYFQCMNNWYEKGWLDQNFNERTADMFYQIDNTTVRQGKIGMWRGMQSELGGRLDSGDEYTDGIFAMGCALPINDVYGDESDQNVIPNCIVTGQGLNGTGYALTSAIEEKDIPTLLTAMDYMFTEEGAVLASLGLNSDQMAETGTSFYENNGIAEGAYKINEEGRYEWVDAIKQDSGGLKGAATLEKFPHLQLVKSIDQGYADTYEHSMELWIQYKNTAQIQGSPITNNMTSEDSDACGDIMNKCLDYITINAVDFIKGKKDIDSDKDWGDWCKMLEKYNYKKAIDIYQPYADKYEI